MSCTSSPSISCNDFWFHSPQASLTTSYYSDAFTSCMRCSMMKLVANLVSLGFKSSSLDRFLKRARLLWWFVMNFSAILASAMTEETQSSLPMSSSNRSRQCGVQGVNVIWGKRASSLRPAALQTAALSMHTWTTISAPTSSIALPTTYAMKSASLVSPLVSTLSRNFSPLGVTIRRLRRGLFRVSDHPSLVMVALLLYANAINDLSSAATDTFSLSSRVVRRDTRLGNL